jgi:Ca2+-binding EF-hand superfamily protein
MSISSVGSSSLTYGTSAVNSRNFRSVQGTVSKDDLSQLASEIESAGQESSSLLQALQTNYESIDTNGDGISFDELQAYAKANGLNLPKGRDMHGTPPALSKDELIKMRDNVAAEDSTAAEGFSQVIERFDEADTDKDGTISMDEMQTFTKANNIDMPKPNGGPEGAKHMPPPPSDSTDSDDQSANDLLKMVRQMCLKSYDTYSLSSSTESAGVALTA